MHAEGIPSPELCLAWLLAREERRGRSLGQPQGRDGTAVLSVYLFKALPYWGSLGNHMSQLLQLKEGGREELLVCSGTGGIEEKVLDISRSRDLGGSSTVL